jgi:hypothetical protein
MSRLTRFTMTAEHVALLRRANVRWEECEYGAPSIDCKRPYGNSGVESDIAEILGWPKQECPHCGEDLGDDKWRERAKALHEETETALQIVLAVGSFEPGTFACDQYMRNWKRIP